MSYQLVIAEKPSVARSIAGVIGATEEAQRIFAGKQLSGELVHRASGVLC